MLFGVQYGLDEGVENRNDLIRIGHILLIFLNPDNWGYDRRSIWPIDSMPVAYL